MDIHELRRERLRQVVAERFDGKPLQLAKAIDRSPSSVYRWFSNGSTRKNLGHDLAREIERVLGLPAFWLDGGTPPIELTPRGWGVVQRLQTIEQGGAPDGLYELLEAALRVAEGK